MKKLQSTFPNMLLSLTIICLVMGAILGLIKVFTDKPIAATELKNKTEAIMQVVPEFDNNPLDEIKEFTDGGEKDIVRVYTARKGDTPVGYAVETFTKNGFGGRFDIMVGFDAAGVIHDFSVLKHAETPGLGAKMQEWFHLENSGSNIRHIPGVDMAAENGVLVVSKDGGKVDAITASTITSRAFLDAVNRAYRFYKEVATGGSEANTEATDAADQATNDNATADAATAATHAVENDNAANAEKGE